MIDLGPPPQLYIPARPALIRAHQGDLDALQRLDRERGIKAMLPGMVPVVAGGRYPTILSTNNGGANGSARLTTWAAPLPPSIAAGKLLLIHGAAAEGAATRTVSTPAGWSSLFNEVGQSSLRRVWCFYKIASGSEGATVDITASGDSYWSGVSYLIDGYQGVPIAAGAVVNATTATPNPPSITLPWGTTSKSLVLAVCSDDVNSAADVGAPSGYSDLISGRNVNGAEIWSRSTSAIKRVLGTNEDPGTFTIPASGPASAHTIAIRGA